MASDPPIQDSSPPATAGGPADPAPPTSGQSLAQRALSGDDPDMALLAARGLLPLPPEELIPVQVRLAAAGSGEVAEQAARSLEGVEVRVLTSYLARRAGEEELGWFARHGNDPRVLETVIRRRDVPRRLLVEMAPRLPSDLQEALVLRQDAILEEPEIVDALESNPDLSAYARRRLREYRDHLLPRDRKAEPAAPVEEDVEPGTASPAEVAAAVEKARREEAAGEEDPATGLSEAQIRFLPIPVRLGLTRGAPRGLRSILIRDPNPMVAKAVLRNNRFSEQEIENICQNRNMDSDILGEIGGDREWVSKYRIVQALVHNPRTPLALAVKLVPRLSVRDLRMLLRDRNVPDAVRTTARRLYNLKRI